MEIQRGPITLKQIASKDLELVRQWRNSTEVNQFMEYREYITPEMQEQWFQKINNEHNLYFLITVHVRAIGLIYGADIDWKKNIVGNAGIFIANDEDRENRYALEASILINDWAFAIGIETIFIKILRDNRRAIMYNKILGYQLMKAQDRCYNQQYYLRRDDYYNSRKKIAPLLSGEQAFDTRITDDTHIIIASRVKELANRIGGTPHKSTTINY